MAEPTDPTDPTAPLPAAKPPRAGAKATSKAAAAEPPAPDAPAAPAAAPQSFPPAPAAGGPGGPTGGPTGPGQPGGPIPGYAAGPPPKKPGLWRQATSTTGGLIAVVVAGALTALLVVGVLAVGAVATMRAVGGHHDEQMGQVSRRGDGVMPQGPGRRLDRNPQQQAPQPRQRGNGQGAPAPQGGGVGSLLNGAMGLGNVQHGDFTATDGTGKTTSMTLQRGAVTAVSTTSLSVKSDDGFTAKYVLDSSTLGRPAGLANGDRVLVVADKAGAKAVLVRATR